MMLVIGLAGVAERLGKFNDQNDEAEAEFMKGCGGD